MSRAARPFIRRLLSRITLFVIPPLYRIGLASEVTLEPRTRRGTAQYARGRTEMHNLRRFVKRCRGVYFKKGRVCPLRRGESPVREYSPHSHLRCVRARVCVCTLYFTLSSLLLFDRGLCSRLALSRRGRVKGFTGRCVLRLSRAEAQRNAYSGALRLSAIYSRNVYARANPFKAGHARAL